MSIIGAIRTYLATYDGLKNGALVLVDALGSDAPQYSVNSVPGAKAVESYLNGGAEREFPFVIQADLTTADDIERVENSEFFENLSDWFDTQSEAGVLPALGSGKTATKIESVNWSFILEQGNNDTAIYQITCKLTYET